MLQPSKYITSYHTKPHHTTTIHHNTTRHSTAQHVTHNSLLLYPLIILPSNPPNPNHHPYPLSTTTDERRPYRTSRDQSQPNNLQRSSTLSPRGRSGYDGKATSGYLCTVCEQRCVHVALQYTLLIYFVNIISHYTLVLYQNMLSIQSINAQTLPNTINQPTLSTHI